MKWTYLVLGSIAGGFARYLIAGSLYKRLGAGAGFPIGTLLVNLSGCLAIGIFYSLAEVKHILGPDERILLMTGFCGAYTTFSSFMLETSVLMNEGAWVPALANVGISVLLGFACVRLGAWVGRAI